MKKFEITKKQILELHSSLTLLNRDAKLKNWFPEAFIDNVETGKWYVTCFGSIYYVDKIKGCSIYGYGVSGVNKKWIGYTGVCDLDQIEREATREEVGEALLKEAKKRGYKVGDKFKSLDGYSQHTINELNYNFNFKRTSLRVLSPKNEWTGNGGNGCSNPAIYKEGKWAEIIEEKPKRKMTVSQICEELGEEIEIIKE